MHTPLIALAESFARTKHADQLRKYTGRPYADHLHEVAFLVSVLFGCEEQIAAAWLHDVIEDTPTTAQDLANAGFPQSVIDMVVDVTNVYTHETHPKLNREQRKEMERKRIERLPFQSLEIKCCDLISNTRTIAWLDPNFARVYLVEKFLLLDAIKGKVPDLFFTLAHKTCVAGWNQLKGRA